MNRVLTRRPALTALVSQREAERKARDKKEKDELKKMKEEAERRKKMGMGVTGW